MTRHVEHWRDPAAQQARPVRVLQFVRRNSLAVAALSRAFTSRLEVKLRRIVSQLRRPAVDKGCVTANLAARLTAAEAALAEAERRHRAFVEALGVAVYTTDVEGRLTSYNESAAALWGWRPPIGEQFWCGSWRLLWPDGAMMRHEECPMALALREGRPVRGAEAIAERPDGSRVPFIPYPTPLRDERGTLIGAVNVLVDITPRKQAEAALAENEARLRAVVETTPECIKLVAPDGTLLQMNQAGLRMIQAEVSTEAEGRSVFGLIAPEHRAAWRTSHERVCRGEALSWEFDTVGLHGARRRMETHAVPLRLPDGQFAQLAITRDVTERKAAEERQVLLVREVDHRAKNVLAVALSMVRLTRAEDPRGFAEAVEGRIAALAHAHTLLADEGWSGADLHAVAERELAAHLAIGRIALRGGPVSLAPSAVQAVSIVLHELATNAAKYGALSVPDGRVEVAWEANGSDGLRLTWAEHGGPPIAEPPRRQGFGSKLIDATVRSQLGGMVALHWEPAGLHCRLTVAANRLLAHHVAAAMEPSQVAAISATAGAYALAAPLTGRRVLVAEDEPLVALELEGTLRDLGCEVVGPAATVDEALRLVTVELERLDAAVLDVNLAGRASFPVADALAQRGVPVVFATGYGDLPDGRAAGGGLSVLLRKPLRTGELEAALLRMLDVHTAWHNQAAEITPLSPSTARHSGGT